MKLLLSLIVITTITACDTERVREMKLTAELMKIDGKRMDCRGRMQDRIEKMKLSSDELQDFIMMADYLCDEIHPRPAFKVKCDQCDGLMDDEE